MSTTPLQLGGRRGLSFGLQLPPELRQQQEQPQPESGMMQEPPSLAAALGRSTGASMTPAVESGNVLEALAAALEGGLHGRAAYAGQQREESQQHNELARALAGDEREQTRWQGEQDYRTRALEQDQSQFDATLAADQAITPYQQAQLDLQRRSLELRGGGGAPPPLRAGDQRLLDRATEQSESAQSFNGLVQRFIGLNAVQPTGTGTDLNPGSWFGESRDRRQEMEGLTAQMITQVRGMSGEGGIMTDSDAQRFERGLPSVHRGGPTNQNFAAAAREVARNAEDRANFLESASASGSLQGTRANWSYYTRANPIYDRYGNIRTDRPGFEEWLADGAPDMSQELAPDSAAEGVSTEDAERELQRRQGGTAGTAGSAPAREELPRGARSEALTPRPVRGGY